MIQPLKQVAKFGTVGLFATATHTGIYALSAGPLGINPLLANLIAFTTAFAISFAGHLQWTFKPDRSHTDTQTKRLFKFLVTALAGLALNSLFTWVIVVIWNQHYSLAVLPMLSVTPLVTFIMSKLWAFK